MAKPQKGVADAAAKLIAKYGARAVRNALKAANKPSKIRSGQTERAKFMDDVMGIYNVQKTKNLKQAYRVNQINRRNPLLSGNKADLPKKASGPKTAKDLAKMKKALEKKRK